MKQCTRMLLCGLVVGAICCGDSDGPSDESKDTGAVDSDGADAGATLSTYGVLCDLNESGEQQLVYEHGGGPGGGSGAIDETLGYNFVWTCDASERTLSGNGVPNHSVTGGRFASKVAAQTISQSLPNEPALTTMVTQVKEPGYALNSIKFDPGTAGTCPDDAVDDGDCDYAMGSDTWSMVATAGDVSPWKFGFGVDENDAHVQPNGQYHYHGNPVGLVAKLNANYETSMTLVGWAMDGFPIYSLRGHSDANDEASAIVEMKSSYQKVETPAAGRPSTTDFPLGHFTQDWQYVDGSGDLDECNGRFAVTPEFPSGIYHYYITSTYPFVQRCVKGTSAGGTMGPPPGR